MVCNIYKGLVKTHLECVEILSDTLNKLFEPRVRGRASSDEHGTYKFLEKDSMQNKQNTRNKTYLR